MAQSTFLGWKGLARFDNDGTRSELARSIEHFDTFEQASHWFQQSSRQGALSERDTLTLISIPTYVALLNGQVSLDRFVVKDLENEGYTCDQLFTQDGENRYQLKCTDGGDVTKHRKSLKTVGPPKPPQSNEELYFYRVSPAKWSHHRSPFRNLLPYKDRHSADTFIRDPDAVLKAVTQCGLDYFLPKHFDHSSRANDPEYALARSPMPQGPGSRCGSHPNVQITGPHRTDETRSSVSPLSSQKTWENRHPSRYASVQSGSSAKISPIVQQAAVSPVPSLFRTPSHRHPLGTLNPTAPPFTPSYLVPNVQPPATGSASKSEAGGVTMGVPSSSPYLPQYSKSSAVAQRSFKDVGNLWND